MKALWRNGRIILKNNPRFWNEAIRSNKKKYIQWDCLSLVSRNDKINSFVGSLLMSDNMSLSAKKHGGKIGSSVYRLFPTPLYYVYVNQ